MGNVYYEEVDSPPACYERLEDYEMPNPINLKAMDDHDLLVMSVMQGNETTKQQEKIILHLAELNGTVKSDHAWIGALRWMVYVLFIIVISALTTTIIGVW